MSCVHEFSLRMHTLVSNHALRAWILSPNAYFGLEPCFARKQTMLAGYEGIMLCSHVRPACGGTLSRVSAASRATCFTVQPVQVSFEKMKCHLPTYTQIGDPLYTTFQKIFTIIRIFLKSEAPKALYSSHSFIVSALIKEV